MSRGINPTTLAALGQKVVPLAVMVDITLSSGVMYLWTGYGSITYSGNTYVGLGNLTSIGNSSEASVVIAQGLTLTLSGIGTDISEALTDITQGQPVYVYLAVLSGNSIVGEPFATYVGQTDAVSIIDDPDGTCSVTVEVENRLTQLQRNRAYRWTSAQMQQLNPSEQGFIYTANLSDYVALWGNSSN